MKNETKDIKRTLLIVCSVWLITAGTASLLLENNRKHKDTITELRQDNKTLKEFGTERDSLYQNQSQINLRLRMYIDDSDEEKLKQDANYLNLVTK